MTRWDEWEESEEYPEWAYEPADHCDRCGAVLTVGHCTDVEVWFPGTGAAEWFWCDECADSFTAWRLTRDGQADDRGQDDDASRVREERP